MNARLCLLGFIVVLLLGACRREVDEARAQRWMDKAEEIKAQFVRDGMRDEERFFKDLIRAYSKAIEYNPNLEVAHLRKGAAHFILKEYGRAGREFTKVVELNPDNTDAYYGRAQCYERQGKSDRAQDDYKKACDLGMAKACLYLPK